jgi:G3E family GTPase
MLMRVSTAVPELTRLPLTIIGGEAGAGKTTLLGQLLSQENVEGVAVVLDGVEPSAELAQLRPRLSDTTHVLIEARGDSSLRRVAGYGYMPGYRLDGIIVVINAQEMHDRLADPERRRRMTTQLREADILVINKLDVVDAGRRALHHAWLDEELPRLRVIETSHGKVASLLLLGVSPEVARMDARAVPGTWETIYPAARRARSVRATATEPRCRVWSIETARPISAQRFRSWISQLPRTLVRCRGDVLIEEDPQLRYQFHMIGHRWHLQREQPWGDVAPQTQLTLVGM